MFAAVGASRPDFDKVDRTSDEYVLRVVALAGPMPQKFYANGLSGIFEYEKWYRIQLRFVAMSELELLYKKTSAKWKREALRKEAWFRSREG